jgi:hypothetical protein
MPLLDLGSVDDMIKRFKSASTNYDNFRSLHQETYDFVAPQRETFRFHAPGQEKNRHVFDSTAVVGLEKFVSRVKGSNMPSWRHWAKLVSGSTIPENKVSEINKDLDKGNDVFFNALNHSNFETEITPALTDLGVGTGGIIIDQGEFNSGEVFKFTNVPLAELYPEKPGSGRIRSAWRKHKVQAGKIKQVWADAKVEGELAKIAEKNPAAEIELLNGQLFNPKDGKYYNVVIYEAEKQLIFDQLFDSQRFLVFRWNVIPGEVYGRGPAMQSLPDIRTLNKIVEFKLQALALEVGGVFTGVNDGVFNPNTVRISPKTIIPVASNNSQNPTLAALQIGGNPSSVDLSIRELQGRINEAFFASPLGDISDPVRSATENTIRQQEMLKQAGASFGRMRSELIEPLIAAGIDILKGIGEFPDISIDGKEVTLKHTSPLAQAEDLESFQNILTWAQANIGIVGPEIFMGTAKVEDFVKKTAELLGIEPSLVRSDDERDAIGKAAASAAQQQLEGGASEPV